MRIGIIGHGSIGKRHTANALRLGHEVLLWDIGRRRGESVCSCDAIVICTPARTHAEVARELADAGYAGPLMCEKPLALTVAGCEVFSAWPSVTTLVGYQLRFHPAIKHMQAMVPSPTSGSFVVESDMQSWPGYEYGPELLEYSHEIDLAIYMGAPARVDLMARRDSRFTLMLGAWRVAIQTSTDDYYREWTISNEYGHTAQKIVSDSCDVSGHTAYIDELAHFLACVEKNEPTMTPFADGIRVVDVCEQAMKLAGATV